MVGSAVWPIGRRAVSDFESMNHKVARAAYVGRILLHYDIRLTIERGWDELFEIVRQHERGYRRQ